MDARQYQVVQHDYALEYSGFDDVSHRIAVDVDLLFGTYLFGDDPSSSCVGA